MKTTRSLPTKIIAGALAAATFMSLTFAGTRNAHAFLPLQVIGYIKQAYGYYKAHQEWVGPANPGPSLAAQLEGLKNEIFDELRMERQEEWKANAKAVASNFRSLVNSGIGDPTVPSLWGDTITLSGQTLNHFAEIVYGGRDLGSSYALAGAFNVLQVYETGLRKIKGEHFPNYPAVWGDYQQYLQQAMNVNYQLVGAAAYMCWPGSNPGRGHYTRTYATSTYDETGFFERRPPYGTGNLPASLKNAPVSTLNGLPIIRSQLWRYLVNHHSYPLGYHGPRQVMVGDTRMREQLGSTYTSRSCATSNGYADPSNNDYALVTIDGRSSYVCDGYCSSCSVHIQDCFSIPTACRGGILWLGYKGFKENPSVGWGFDPDPNVQAVREGMKGIQGVGGGDERWDWSSTALPAEGRLTDPWVDEPNCTNTSGNGGGPNPWAYAMNSLGSGGP